jgi:hypothetical protein
MDRTSFEKSCEFFMSGKWSNVMTFGNISQLFALHGPRSFLMVRGKNDPDFRRHLTMEKVITGW